MRSTLGVSNGFGHFDPKPESKWSAVRQIIIALTALYGTYHLVLDALHQLMRWVIP